MKKVRIKATGEIKELVPRSYIWVKVPNSAEYKDYKIEDVEFVSETNDSMRFELAKSAMQSLLLLGNNSHEWIAKRAFEIADTMIKQLNK